ncbi:glycoside hydrolase family 2 protein [Ancylomarina sp. 16SWW S1-10-2]|uniref:glycoside hydrolase family 2 protein n=1 Tax=Ancylomarina sp. 16SWW S1-10-2 TaxID=2499681 RepID=UPI001E5818FB|nr:sugar-binding domain-containing protein [Ancylomarina sp. 16SWW S1-10-2]
MSNRRNFIRKAGVVFILAIMFITVSAENNIKGKFSTAGFYGVEGSPREVYNFNPGWRFYKGDVKGAELVNFDDSKWEAANLPHGLEILGENGSGGRNYQGKAWYRKQFEIQNKEVDGRTYLYFEAVMGKCKIWVNGNLLAEHFGGYLPVAIDITDVTNPKGKRNIVAVMADNSDDKTYLPGKNQSGLDFAYFGGIYRDTYLIQTSSVHFTLPELSKTVAGAGVFVATLDVNGNDAKMEMRTELTNESKKSVNATVKIVLENEDFQPVKEVLQKVKLKAGAKRQLSSKLSVSNVHLWHPDDPYLHFVRTEIIINGKIVDQMRTRVGIRLFEMRGADGLFINKKFYDQKLIGANRHQDYSYIGNALPNSGQWRDVKLLREGGCRIIRVGHYPQDPAFYDACDELGMLTTTANPGWHFFNFKNPIFEERLYNDTRELVRRDRNVASILMWETALNETPKQPDHAMHNMHLIAHEEYPFPGMFTVTDHQEAKKGGLDMYYHGDDKNVNSFNREYGDGWEVDNWQSQNSMSRVKMEWGEKAMLTQALRQAKELNDRYPTPKVRIGGAKWAGIDHQRGYHPDPFWGGLLNGVRLPKYAYYVYKSQYDADYKVRGIETGPMLFNANELTQTSPKDVVIFSNCDEIRLYWLGELVVTQKPSNDKAYADMPHPPFIFEKIFDFEVIKSAWRRKTKDVEMIAEGLIDGKVVIRDVKNYPEQSAGLKLSVADEGMNLTADGSDIIPVRATIVDPDGMKKVLASEYVYFEVDGPAEIIGGKFNMGNPVKTEMGIATVLVRASTKPGVIKLRAFSNGLKSDSITIESKPSSLKKLFNEDYLKASIKPSSDQTVIIQKDRGDMPMDVVELQKEIKQLRLEKVGKEQEIMELRSQLKGK